MKTRPPDDDTKNAAVDLDAQREAFNGKWAQSPKHFLPKALVQRLGPRPVMVLSHLQWSLLDKSNYFPGEKKQIIEFDNGKFGLQQSIPNMACALHESPDTIKTAINKLVKDRLVFKREARGGIDRSAIWLLNYDKLAKLLDRAEQLSSSKNDTTETLTDSTSGNFDLMETLTDSTSGENDLMHQVKTTRCIRSKLPDDIKKKNTEFKKEEIAKAIMQSPPSPLATATIDGGVSENSFFMEFEEKDKRPVINNQDKVPPKQSEDNQEAQIDRYVKYWNDRPYTPKCKPGSKAYTRCVNFFKAHQRYAIGKAPWFLPADYQERINLAELNEEATHAAGKRRKERSDTQMYQHIYIAARAFDPNYQPQNKKVLGGSLVNFLYTSFSKAQGQSSKFLQCISNPSKRLDDVSSLLDSQEEHVRDIVEIITDVYNQVRGRTHDPALADNEVRTAIRIAGNISREYLKIPTYRDGALQHFFPDCLSFAKNWRKWAIEKQKWEGMPLSALDTAGKIWGAYVDFVQKDLGRDIFTGSPEDREEYEGSVKKQVQMNKEDCAAEEKAKANIDKDAQKLQRDNLKERIAEVYTYDYSTPEMLESIKAHVHHVFEAANGILDEAWQDNEYEVQDCFEVTRCILAQVSKNYAHMSTKDFFSQWAVYVVEHKDDYELNPDYDEKVSSVHHLSPHEHTWLWFGFTDTLKEENTKAT